MKLEDYEKVGQLARTLKSAQSDLEQLRASSKVKVDFSAGDNEPRAWYSLTTENYPEPSALGDCFTKMKAAALAVAEARVGDLRAKLSELGVKF